MILQEQLSQTNAFDSSTADLKLRSAATWAVRSFAPKSKRSQEAVLLSEVTKPLFALTRGGVDWNDLARLVLAGVFQRSTTSGEALLPYTCRGGVVLDWFFHFGTRSDLQPGLSFHTRAAAWSLATSPIDRLRSAALGSSAG